MARASKSSGRASRSKAREAVKPKTTKSKKRKLSAKKGPPAKKKKTTKKKIVKAYKAEKLVKMRNKGNGVEYLVKWEGYGEDENTWTPEPNIVDDELIEKFKVKHAKKKKASKKKKKESKKKVAGKKRKVPSEDKKKKKKKKKKSGIEFKNSDPDARFLNSLDNFKFGDKIYLGTLTKDSLEAICESLGISSGKKEAAYKKALLRFPGTSGFETLVGRVEELVGIMDKEDVKSLLTKASADFKDTFAINVKGSKKDLSARFARFSIFMCCLDEMLAKLSRSTFDKYFEKKKIKLKSKLAKKEVLAKRVSSILLKGVVSIDDKDSELVSAVESVDQIPSFFMGQCLLELSLSAVVAEALPKASNKTVDTYFKLRNFKGISKKGEEKVEIIQKLTTTAAELKELFEHLDAESVEPMENKAGAIAAIVGMTNKKKQRTEVENFLSTFPTAALKSYFACHGLKGMSQNKEKLVFQLSDILAYKNTLRTPDFLAKDALSVSKPRAKDDLVGFFKVLYFTANDVFLKFFPKKTWFMSKLSSVMKNIGNVDVKEKLDAKGADELKKLINPLVKLFVQISLGEDCGESAVDAKMEKYSLVPLPKKKEKKLSAKEKRKKSMPKRALSSYNMFCREMREEIRLKNKSAKQNEIMGLVAAAWNKITPKKKQKFEKMASVDKVRYDKELESWSAKQPPKAPLSAYIHFVKDQRDAIEKKFTKKGKKPEFKVMGSLLAEAWKNLASSKKVKYENMQVKDKARYEVDHKKWKLKYGSLDQENTSPKNSSKPKPAKKVNMSEARVKKVKSSSSSSVGRSSRRSSRAAK